MVYGHYMAKAVATTIGIFLVVLGVFGLFLPLLQGILLILLGVFILKNRNMSYQDIKLKFKNSFKRKIKS